jgi:hypothetical protein
MTNRIGMAFILIFLLVMQVVNSWRIDQLQRDLIESRSYIAQIQKDLGEYMQNMNETASNNTGSIKAIIAILKMEHGR